MERVDSAAMTWPFRNSGRAAVLSASAFCPRSYYQRGSRGILIRLRLLQDYGRRASQSRDPAGFQKEGQTCMHVDGATTERDAAESVSSGPCRLLISADQ